MTAPATLAPIVPGRVLALSECQHALGRHLAQEPVPARQGYQTSDDGPDYAQLPPARQRRVDGHRAKTFEGFDSAAKELAALPEGVTTDRLGTDRDGAPWRTVDESHGWEGWLGLDLVPYALRAEATAWLGAEPGQFAQILLDASDDPTWQALVRIKLGSKVAWAEQLGPLPLPGWWDEPDSTLTALLPNLGTLGERAAALSREAAASDATTISPPTETALDVVTADQVEVRRVRYLWDRRIPLGAVTLMPGEEGIGKTTVGVRIIADQTRGALPGEFWGTPRDVIVLATEDGLEDVFVPRLREAGAVLPRVHIIRARIGLDGDKHSVIVPRDLALIGELVRQHSAALVWIDSLVTTLPDELKSIAYKDTAKVLRALGNWAETMRVAVVAPWHLNKASGSDTAVRIMDSRAFRTAVRSMLLVVPDPDAPEGSTQGIVALDKANAGTLDVPGLRYRIRSANYLVEEADEQTGEVREISASCGVADWISEVAGDGRQIARDALMPRVEQVGTAREWLRKHLSGGIEIARTDVMAAAEEDGFSEDQIKRASKALRVTSRQETGHDPASGRPWRSAIWSLPQSGGQSVHTPPAAPTAPTGEGSNAPTTSIYAGQSQSVQSVQSGVSGRNRPTGRPTVEQPACACGEPLLAPVSIEADSCARCRIDGPPERAHQLSRNTL